MIDMVKSCREALPDSAVADVQMAYDISRLQTLSQELYVCDICRYISFNLHASYLLSVNLWERR